MPPEMRRNSSFKSSQADIYSAGVTLFNMVTGCAFQPDLEMNSEFWAYFKAENLSSELKNLLRMMLAPYPQERICLEKVMEHQWMSQELGSEEEFLHKFYKVHPQIGAFLSSFKLTKNGDQNTRMPRSKSLGSNKISKKNTCFYRVKKGNKLVKAIIDFAKSKGYNYKKSSKFCQVQLFSGTPKQDLHVVVNVIKSHFNKDRCCQLTLIKGVKSDFYTLFSDCNDFLDRRF